VLPTYSWIDTHCHLNDDTLRPSLSDVLRRAAQQRVNRILCVAVDAATSRNGLSLETDLADSDLPRVYFTAGIHPNYAHQESPGDWDIILERLGDPRVVALGETGLDQYWDDCPFHIQQRNFHRHFEASRESGLPVIIHSRDCDEPMLATLRRERQRGELHGVMHSFTGSMAMAQECIDMGLYISFSGIVTYKKNQELRRVAAQIPEDCILMETDAPYLSPDPFRSTRPNEPSLMIHTASVVAEARAISLEQLANATTANALRLFGKIRD
jgi:TatD DNase family protein